MIHQPTAILGLSELGFRHPGQAERVIGLAHHAGLIARRMVIRCGADINPPLPDKSLVLGLASAMAAAGITGEVHSVANADTSPTPDSVARAAADPAVSELEFSGDGWALFLSMNAGLVSGVSANLDIAKHATQRFLLGLFDAGLADWGVAGPHPSVMEETRRCEAFFEDGKSPHPPIGRFTWRGPDLLTDVDALATTWPPGIELHRSITGGVALVADAKLNPQALLQASKDLGEAWQPPPLRWYATANSAIALRSASGHLVARQQLLAKRFVQRTGAGVAGFSSLVMAENLVAHTDTPAEEIEEFSAYVGTIAVKLGGSWHRLFDPSLQFPSGLLVLMQNQSPFYPHIAVINWYSGGVPPSKALELACREGS